MSSVEQAEPTGRSKLESVVISPEAAARQALDGSIAKSDLSKMPMSAQALVLEVLLERDRDRYFDAEGSPLNGEFQRIITEVLGVDLTRARSLMKVLRANKVYTSPGRGGKVVFLGSERAAALLGKATVGRQERPANGVDLSRELPSKESRDLVLPLDQNRVGKYRPQSEARRLPSAPELVDILAENVAESVWRQAGQHPQVVERVVEILRSRIFEM